MVEGVIDLSLSMNMKSVFLTQIYPQKQWITFLVRFNDKLVNVMLGLICKLTGVDKEREQA